MTSIPTERPIMTPQRPASRSAAGQLIHSLWPSRPDPGWDGILRLRALPDPAPFPMGKKARRADGDERAMGTIRDGRGLVFQPDRSAIAVRAEGEGWRVLPVPMAISHQIMADGFPQHGEGHPHLLALAHGPMSLGLRHHDAPAMVDAYADVFFRRIDALWEDPRWNLPLGDVRLLGAATTLPADRLYHAWSNWQRLDGRERDRIERMLAHLVAFVQQREDPFLQDDETLSLGARVEMFPGDEDAFGHLRASLTSDIHPRSRARTPAFQAIKALYDPVIRSWFSGPSSPLAPHRRHVPDRLVLFPRAMHLESAHERMAAMAMFAAMSDGVAWPEPGSWRGAL